MFKLASSKSIRPKCENYNLNIHDSHMGSKQAISGVIFRKKRALFRFNCLKLFDLSDYLI